MKKGATRAKIIAASNIGCVLTLQMGAFSVTIENSNLVLSARNLPKVKIIVSSNLNVKDLLEADNLIITESAILEITERLSK